MSGPAAIDGTGSHLLLETCMISLANVKAADYINKVVGAGHPEMPQGWLVDTARATRVQLALDYIERRRAEIDISSVEAESHSNPGQYFNRTDWWGTVDITIKGVDKLTGQKILEIADYKDGAGFVEVDGNSQLLAYAAGKLGEMIVNPANNKCNPKNEPHLVRMTIIQPKISNKPIRFVEMDSETLWGKAKELATAAIKTDDPLAPLVVGDHCQWCKHRDACEERTAKALDGISMLADTAPLFESLQAGQISVDSMDDARLAAILDAEPIITALLDNVRKEALTRLKAGHSVPGYTIGNGKGKNVWTDDLEMVEKKLKGMRFTKDDLFPPKLVSPAQALKKEGLTERQIARIKQELIIYTPGDAKVVKSNLQVKTAAELFASLPDITPPTSPVAEDLDNLSFL
jgi:hypothetical protein